MSLTRRRKIIIGLILSLAFSAIVVLSLLFQPPPKGIVLIDSDDPNMATGINDEGKARGFLLLKNREIKFFTWTSENGLVFSKENEDVDRKLFNREINSLGQKIKNIEIDGINHAFVILSNGEEYKLPLLSGDMSRAHAINNEGQVAGYIAIAPPWWKKGWNTAVFKLGFPDKYMFSTYGYDSAKATVWTTPPEDD